MTKHQGLAQLADTANPVHYPVRRRGEKRRLEPNWVGIAWLEAEQLEETEIASTITPQPLDAYNRFGEGLTFLLAAGRRDVIASGFRERSTYVRPMFQILRDHIGSAAGGAHYRGCATCYDLQYPGRECEIHNDSTKPQERAPVAYVSHTCALAGRGDCDACVAQSSTPAPDLPPEAFAEPGGMSITDAINESIRRLAEAANEAQREEMRLDRSLWEGIREAAAEPPTETPWQDLVQQYQRILEQQTERATSRELERAAQQYLRSRPSPNRFLVDELHRYTYTPPREVPSARALELRVDGQTVEGVQSFTIHVEEGRTDER